MRPEFVFDHGARAVVTTRADGDQRSFSSNRASIAGVSMPWTLVRQVHGSRVVTIDHPLGDLDEPADALVTARRGTAIAVLGADCSLIGLADPDGIIAVAHAGWRGLLDGVIEATVARMRELGAREISAVIGPTIGPECYAFSPADLSPIVSRYGPRVHSRTREGSDALDLVAAVELALLGTGVRVQGRLGGCTSCDPLFYSWRGARDEHRHALVLCRGANETGDAGD